MGEPRFALITGPPGIGKTTLIKKLYALCKPAVGFYTEEVRGPNGVRLGFDIISLEDEKSRKPLARESSAQRGPKVGKYTVQIPEFESVAIPCLEKAQNYHDEIIIIDEIGNINFLKHLYRIWIYNSVQVIFITYLFNGYRTRRPMSVLLVLMNLATR